MIHVIRNLDHTFVKLEVIDISVISDKRLDLVWHGDVYELVPQKLQPSVTVTLT